MALTKIQKEGIETLINNNADNRIITGSGTANTLEGESGVVIDSSGRLLVGTTTEGHSNADDLTVASSADTGITIRSGTTSQSSLYFSDATSGTGEYAGSVAYNHSNNKLFLATSSSNKLTIDSSGNVGIGTSSPSQELTVAGSDPVISVQEASVSSQVDIGTGTSTGFINIQKADGTRTVQLSGSTDSYFTGGNVGIGTTSPTSALNVAGRLDVDGLQNQNTAEIFANSTSGQSFGLLVNAGSTSGDYCANFRDKDAGAIMILRGDGQIGIGTSSPNRTIEIKKSSPGIRLEETSSGGSKRLELFMDGSEANIAAPQSAQQIMFSVSGADTMRLARSGSHAEMFLNCNETFSSAVFSLQTNGSCGIGLKTGATNTQKHISFRNPNGEVGQIVTGSNSTTYDTTSDYRLKENEVAISDGITRLKTLKPYKFNFKNTPSEILDGFYAHEVMTVVPQAVNGEKDEVDSNGDPKYQGIDHSMIVPLLVAAVKELITKVEALEAA